MKQYSLKMLSVLLMAVLLLVGTAFAETPDLHTVTLPSGKSYTFPMTVAECEAAGIPLPQLNVLSDDQYYPSVPVNNGREQFSVRVELDAATGEFCVTGFYLTVDDISGAELAGITLGKTTQTEVYEMFGADHWGTKLGESDSLNYYFFLQHESMTIYFDSADANATVKRIVVSSDIAGKYGVNVGESADAAQSDLPAASDLAFNQFILDGQIYQAGDTLQKLLDNGWVLPANRSVDTMIDARDGSRASGDYFDLYNGHGIAKVYVYNTSESDCALSECLINEIVVEEEGKVELICADGLAIGSIAADATELFGEASEQSTEDDGSVVSTFTVLNNLEYKITANDNVVTGISIRGLMNNESN